MSQSEYQQLLSLYKTKTNLQSGLSKILSSDQLPPPDAKWNKGGLEVGNYMTYVMNLPPQVIQNLISLAQSQGMSTNSRNFNALQEADRYFDSDSYNKLMNSQNPPRFVGNGNYSYQLPSTATSTQAVTGYQNSVRLYAWADQIRRLNAQLQEQVRGVIMLNRDVANCIVNNIQDRRVVQSIMNCMNNLNTGVTDLSNMSKNLDNTISQVVSQQDTPYPKVNYY